MLLAELATASADVASSSSRLAKIRRLAAVLRAAGPDESATAVAWLSGELPQRQIGVGWAALRSLPPAADTATLTVAGVDAQLRTIKATRAGARRRDERSCSASCSRRPPRRSRSFSDGCSAASCARARSRG